MVKIAESCDIEVFIDSDFVGEPTVVLNYIDDNVKGKIDINKGIIDGDFSKYVRPVIEDWFEDNKEQLLEMWNSRKKILLPAWE